MPDEAALPAGRVDKGVAELEDVPGLIISSDELVDTRIPKDVVEGLEMSENTGVDDIATDESE